MIDEIWKDIPGYEGFYQISNKGRVKSFKKIAKQFNVSYETINRIKKNQTFKDVNNV